jgi:hypothetical protein
MSSPEYEDSIAKLHQVASFTMDNNLGLVCTNAWLRAYTISTLRLESETGDVILLERSLKTPLPKNPDWTSIVPRIRKADLIDGREWLHDYTDRDGLIIDERVLKYSINRESKLDEMKVVEDECNLEDIQNLTNQIETWTPVDQAFYRKNHVAKLIATILRY